MIREAMVGKGVAALGHVVMNKRERVIALEPHGKGLIGTTLHYAYEVRKAGDYFDDIPDVKIAPDMLKLAQHIVDEKAGEFEPEAFVDHYEQAVVEILRKKQANIPLKKSAERSSAPRTSSTDGMRLRRSVANEKAAPKAAKPEKAAKGKKRVGARARCCCPSPQRRKPPGGSQTCGKAEAGNASTSACRAENIPKRCEWKPRRGRGSGNINLGNRLLPFFAD